MVALARRTTAAFCLLFVAGCVTDELVVYKETVVTKASIKPFIGVYHVEEWPGNAKPESVRVTEKDEDLHFSYSLPDKKVQLHFLLSKIPNSKSELYLLSIPGQDDTNQANMFFIGKAEKGQTHIWAVFSNLPVAKDHLKFQDGKAKEVKKFLAKRADAFVMANEPQVTLKNPER
ncbi:MAG: hypothetical protein H8E66_27525 [Planctomycetes bacterium]|nr:hypothetical protein [Planctomycetota bacterium]